MQSDSPAKKKWTVPRWFLIPGGSSECTARELWRLEMGHQRDSQGWRKVFMQREMPLRCAVPAHRVALTTPRCHYWLMQTLPPGCDPGQALLAGACAFCTGHSIWSLVVTRYSLSNKTLMSVELKAKIIIHKGLKELFHHCLKTHARR